MDNKLYNKETDFRLDIDAMMNWILTPTNPIVESETVTQISSESPVMMVVDGDGNEVEDEHDFMEHKQYTETKYGQRFDGCVIRRDIVMWMLDQLNRPDNEDSVIRDHSVEDSRIFDPKRSIFNTMVHYGMIIPIN